MHGECRSTNSSASTVHHFFRTNDGCGRLAVICRSDGDDQCWRGGCYRAHTYDVDTLLRLQRPMQTRADRRGQILMKRNVRRARAQPTCHTFAVVNNSDQRTCGGRASKTHRSSGAQETHASVSFTHLARLSSTAMWCSSTIVMGGEEGLTAKCIRVRRDRSTLRIVPHQ